ncbi:MAG: hypothetical protein J6R77_03405, partial [Clostridia bacterium]|nr:hypothetical protein [Clostridia bacterium]
APVAYEYFCSEFENMLFTVFRFKEEAEKVGSDNTEQKMMLRNTIIAVVHKVYLDTCFSVLENRE